MPSVERVLNFLRTDPSANEIAEYLVLAEIIKPAPLACAIYLPENRTSTKFVRAGSFGFEPWSVGQANDSWDILTSKLKGIKTLKNGSPIHIAVEPLIAEAERLGYKTMWRTGVESVWLIPIIGRVGPIGVIALYMDNQPNQTQDTTESSPKFEVLASAVGLLLQGEGIQNFRIEPARPDIRLLSDRQERIISQISRGASNSEIAEDLDLSVSTVKLEITKILEELGAKNRKEAVKKAIEVINGASQRKN